MGAKLVPRSSPQAAGPSCAVWDLVLASQCIFLLTTDVVPCCAYVPSQPLRARSHEQGEEKTPPPTSSRPQGWGLSHTFAHPSLLVLCLFSVTCHLKQIRARGLEYRSCPWCVFVLEAVVSTGIKV